MNKLYDYLYWRKRAMLMGAGGVDMWWLAPGMDEADCLAAYDFKAAENSAGANVDLTGHGYGLSLVEYDPALTIDFEAGVGYKWNNTKRGQLKSQTNTMPTALACILKFANASGADIQMAAFGGENTAEQYTSINFNFSASNSGATYFFEGVSVYIWGEYSEIFQFYMPTFLQSASHGITSGVVGVNSKADKIYVNGSSENVTGTEVNAWTIGSNGLIGGFGGMSAVKGSYNLERLAFYGRKLSAAEHQAIGQNIAG